MRFQVEIDAIMHQCDSTDPELLARWLLEVFGRHQWSPATFCRVQAYPSFDELAPDGRAAKVDWLADSRYSDVWSVKTPRELLAHMARTLDRYEADKAEGLI